MAGLVYTLPADKGACSFVNQEGTPVSVNAKELSSTAARIDSQATFSANEYIDITLDLPGKATENLFAQVISSGESGLLVRWLHFDPGEEERLRGVIESAVTDLGITGEERELVPTKSPRKKRQPDDGEKRKTRRIARPRGNAEGETSKPEKKKSGTSAVMPFADTGPVTSEGENKKKKTRKIVKPRQSQKLEAVREDRTSATGRSSSRMVVQPRPKEDDALEPTSEAPPTGPLAPVGEESGPRHVVIEPTARFNKLESVSGAKRKAVDPNKPLNKQTKGKKGTTVFTKDGNIDVGSTLKSHAKTIRASDLAARHDKVRVLNMSTIKELIQVAVQEAVEKLGGLIDEKEKDRLLKEAEENFKEQMAAFQAEKKGLEAQTADLNKQLERAQRLLDDERNKVINADQFTVSESGMEDLEKRFDRLIDRAIKVNSVNDQLADELRGMVTGLLDQERENIADQAKQAQSKAIAMLEKKVSRLAGSLGEVERERDLHRRRADMLEASGPGVSNIMDAGLAEDDPDKERKLSLLKDVFAQNQEMRDALKKEGIEIKGRRRKKPKAPPKEESLEQKAEEAVEAAEQEVAETTDSEQTPAVASTETETPSDAAPDADDPYADMGDPDDAVWEPGMSFSKEVAGDNEAAEDDTGVKKIAAFDNFAPPPLERKSEASSAAADNASDAAEEEEDPYANMVDPDDAVWEPGMSFSKEVAGDNEEAGDDDDVKKISSFKNFEPPPLERK